MNFKLDGPVRRSKTGKKEDNDIREIFYGHWEKMRNQTEAVVGEINGWRSRMITDINRYADEQIRYLEAIYNRQRAVFDQKRDENISIVKDLHQSKANDVFKELCSACRLLEFQVAQLEDVQYHAQRPRVIDIGDQAKGSTQNQSTIHAPDTLIRRSQSMTNHTNVAGKDQNNDSRSSFRIPPHGKREPLINASSNTNNRPTKERNNSNTIINNVQNVNNECPICSMVYPLHMSADDRDRHVNEHTPDG